MPRTIACAHCERPILHRHELCVMGRPAVALHERCLPAWQSARGSLWKSAPLNRLGGLLWLNLALLAPLLIASIWLPWDRLLDFWPLWLVINAGPLLMRAVLWWTIERHVPR